MSIRHAARACAHANECCSLQELFVHWGDGYGSFATNKVRWGGGGVKPHDRSFCASRVSRYSYCGGYAQRREKQTVQRWLQTNREPADEREVVTHSERSRKVFAPLHHSAPGYTFTPWEDIWQHLGLERGDRAKSMWITWPGCGFRLWCQSSVSSAAPLCLTSFKRKNNKNLYLCLPFLFHIATKKPCD